MWYKNRRDDTNNQKQQLLNILMVKKIKQKKKNETNHCINKAKYIFISNNEKRKKIFIEDIKKKEII